MIVYLLIKYNISILSRASPEAFQMTYLMFTMGTESGLLRLALSVALGSILMGSTMVPYDRVGFYCRRALWAPEGSEWVLEVVIRCAMWVAKWVKNVRGHLRMYAQASPPVAPCCSTCWPPIDNPSQRVTAGPNGVTKGT